MLPSLVLYILFLFAEKTKKQKKAAAKAACRVYSKVELIPSDLQARDVRPRYSVVASQSRANGLVPVKSIVVFMRPESTNPLCGTPENVLLLNKKFVDSIVAHTGSEYILMKGALGDLIAPVNDEEDDEEEDDEEMDDEEHHEDEWDEHEEFLVKPKN